MRQLSRNWKIFTGLVGGVLGGVLLYMGLIRLINPTMIIPSVVFISIVLTFTCYPASKTRSPQSRPSPLDLLIMAAALPVCIYMTLNGDKYGHLDTYWLEATAMDIFSGIFLTAVIIEASRRVIGWVLPILMISFLVYMLFLSRFMPYGWSHPGVEWQTVFEQLVRNTSKGYSGKLPFIIVSVAGIFIFLGPTMFATELGNFFMGLARWVGTKLSGGAAMVAVVGSALFGTLSGSAVANVATTGAFTIPTMKSVGFKPAFAAAVEAVASTGGMIMPPIMAAVAFLIPEFIPGISYLDVIKAAVVPALLYFSLVGCSAYFQAKKEGIGALTGGLGANFRDVISNWRGIVTGLGLFGTLLYLLFEHWPTAVCGAWALVAGMVVHLIIGGPFTLSAAKQRLFSMVKAFTTSGAVNLAWLLLVVAGIQIITMSLTATGLGPMIGNGLLKLGGDGGNLMLALLATMVTLLILGMGVSALACYVIAAALLAAPLIKLVGNPLAVHLFIYYFAMIAVITPPVCVASYTAAAIAQSNWVRTGLYGVLLGLGGFIVPYMFIYGQELLLMGDPIPIVIALVSAFIGVYFLASGIWGYLYRSTFWLERLLFGLGGLALMFPNTTTDLFGLAAIVLGLFIYIPCSRKLRKAALNQLS